MPLAWQPASALQETDVATLETECMLRTCRRVRHEWFRDESRRTASETCLTPHLADPASELSCRVPHRIAFASCPNQRIRDTTTQALNRDEVARGDRMQHWRCSRLLNPRGCQGPLSLTSRRFREWSLATRQSS